MTARALLSDLERRGVRVQAAGPDQLRIESPGALTDAERAALREHKAELLRLLGPLADPGSPWPETIGEYRRAVIPFTPCWACGAGTFAGFAGVALCRACATLDGSRILDYCAALPDLAGLGAQGEAADHEAARRAVETYARLTDDLGPTLADRIRAAWTRAHQRCPMCGGEVHE